MDDDNKSTPTTGVSISGGNVTIGGDVVGRDKIVGTQITQTRLDQVFQHIEDAVRTASPEKQLEAEQKLKELKAEAAKGDKADDSIVAKLVKGLVGLVPGAVSAVAGAFGTPILAGIAGPVTKYVLDEIQGK